MKKFVLFLIGIYVTITLIMSMYKNEKWEQTKEETKVEYRESEDNKIDIATVQKHDINIVTEENNIDFKENEEINRNEVTNNEIEVYKHNDRYNIEETSLAGSLKFGYDDALILHKISVAEAGTESVEGMALIMLVVLNRMHSDEFPDSIYDIIHQKKQFTPVSNGSYEKAQPNEKSKMAMELILNGWDESNGALYFETCKGESWHSKNLKLLFKIDDIKFYK